MSDKITIKREKYKINFDLFLFPSVSNLEATASRVRISEPSISSPSTQYIVKPQTIRRVMSNNTTNNLRQCIVLRGTYSMLCPHAIYTPQKRYISLMPVRLVLLRL